jgi:hypothetical protein
MTATYFQIDKTSAANALRCSTSTFAATFQPAASQTVLNLLVASSARRQCAWKWNTGARFHPRCCEHFFTLPFSATLSSSKRKSPSSSPLLCTPPAAANKRYPTFSVLKLSLRPKPPAVATTRREQAACRCVQLNVIGCQCVKCAAARAHTT